MTDATFGFDIPDMAMVDAGQMRLFQEIGRHRSPFQGIASWPWLDERLRQRSVETIAKQGHETWRAMGGQYDDDGHPSFRLTAGIVGDIIDEIESTTGGLLWMDREGMGWAVKLGRPPQADPATRFGFGVSWAGETLWLDPVARDQAMESRSRNSGGHAPVGREEGRRQLEEVARRLRLFTRAEQLLWLVHAFVLRARSSVIVLPDILLGQVVWGGDRDAWPKDWRREVMLTLRSLTMLRSEVFRLDGAGWRPRLGACSVGVASVEQLSVTSPRDDGCRPACPMYSCSHQRHSHIRLQIGLGFLGVLEKFRVATNGENREFDFQHLPAGQGGDELKAQQRRGETPSINLPVAILGPARWSGMTLPQCRIVHAIVREITRVRRSARADNARVCVGNRVPGSKPKQELTCPFLRPNARYVSFSGNGARPGTGYRLIGAKGTGWLHKCGYWAPARERDQTVVVRDFLTDLRRVAEILGLTVVALHPRTGHWLGVRELIEFAQRRCGIKYLDPFHLRIYGPEDYLLHWRTYFEQQGRFRITTGADAAERSGPPESLLLANRLRRLGLRHEDLARALGKNRAYVTKMINGVKPWPQTLLARTEAFIVERETAAAVPAEGTLLALAPADVPSSSR